MLFLGAIGCVDPSPQIVKSEPPNIRIGLITSLTGRHAGYGISTKQGLELAIADHNRGKPATFLKLLVEDDQSEPARARALAERLAATGEVQLFVAGSTTDSAIAVAPVASRAQIPMITPSGTHADITTFGPYVFRTCFSDADQAKAMAQHATQNLRLRRLAILKDIESDYSAGLTSMFATEARKLGAQIVAEEIYAPSDSDFQKPLDAIRESKAEALYIPGYHEDVSRILAEARAKARKMVFLGADGWASSALWNEDSSVSEPSYFTSHFHPEEPNPKVRDFVTAYRKHYNELPDAFAALGYDSGRMIAQASNNSSGDTLYQALSSLPAHSGVTGRIDYSEAKSRKQSTVIVRVASGKTRFHWRSSGHNSAQTSKASQ